MKKLAVAGAAVLVALVVAWAGGTFVVSRQVERRVNAQLDQLAAEIPGLAVLDRTFERGFFASTLVFTLRVGCEHATAPGVPALPDLTFRSRILNGPVPGLRSLGLATVVTELDLPQEIQANLDKLFQGKKPLELRTRVGYLGGFTTRAVSPAFRFTGEPGERVAWEGLRAEVVGTGGGRYTMDLDIPGFSAADERAGFEFDLQGLAMQSKGVATGPALLGAGESHAQLRLLQVRGRLQPGTPPIRFALEELRTDATARLEGGLLSYEGSLTSAGHAGDSKLDRIEASVALRRLDADSYRKLTRALSDGSCHPERAAEALPAIQGELVKFLSHDPEYGIEKLSVQLGDERAEASFWVGAKGVTAADAATPLPVLLKSKGGFRGDVRFPAAWFGRVMGAFAEGSGRPAPTPAQVDEMLQDAAAHGALVRQGQQLTTSVRFVGGELTVNGRPAPM